MFRFSTSFKCAKKADIGGMEFFILKMYANEMNHKVTQWAGEVINKHGTSIGITSSKILLKPSHYSSFISLMNFNILKKLNSLN